MLLEWADNQKEYFEFCRSRIRVLRATFLNTIFIGMSLVIYVKKYELYPEKLVILIISTVLFITIVCYKANENILEKYYEKARLIEKEYENKRKREKK